jgi:hypothetical protein
MLSATEESMQPGHAGIGLHAHSHAASVVIIADIL